MNLKLLYYCDVIFHNGVDYFHVFFYFCQLWRVIARSELEVFIRFRVF